MGQTHWRILTLERQAISQENDRSLHHQQTMWACIYHCCLCVPDIAIFFSFSNLTVYLVLTLIVLWFWILYLLDCLIMSKSYMMILLLLRSLRYMTIIYKALLWSQHCWVFTKLLSFSLTYNNLNIVPTMWFAVQGLYFCHRWIIPNFACTCSIFCWI